VPEQFGFRKGTSIENVVSRLTNNILNTLNEKKQVVGIFVTCRRLLTVYGIIFYFKN
jgi:hypothetical protein